MNMFAAFVLMTAGKIRKIHIKREQDLPLFFLMFFVKLVSLINIAVLYCHITRLSKPFFLAQLYI